MLCWWFHEKKKRKETLNVGIINCALNCEVYSSFEGVSFDHRSITANIRLNLHKHWQQTTKTMHYYRSLFNNRHISDEYIITLKKQVWWSSGDIRNLYSEWRIWKLLQYRHGSGSSRMYSNQTKIKISISEGDINI